MIPEERGNSDTIDSNARNRTNFSCGVIEGFYGKPWTSEQRRKLFKRMQKMGMNTYLYAPKDDSKHRMHWRELYTVEEADMLTALIEASEEHSISFVYALSPGLDMTYSSVKEVSCLKRKLSQVASFGCRAFALLFDDIEADMCEADKSFYQSFAFAQVSVTNEIYQHLHEPPLFFFCPTEYCASRAVPTVAQSEYLTTVGAKLLHGIDVMWTGPKVISKRITIQSIEEVAKVLQRPPLIWDNIHANDYDQKRLFLGPYDGRSPDIIPYVRGVLTNPNCEFESNYIALHTLAQWSRSNADGVKKDFVTSDSSVNNAGIRLETDGEYNPDEDDSPINSTHTYISKHALKMALLEWHSEFFERCPAPRRVISHSSYSENFASDIKPLTSIVESPALTMPDMSSKSALDPMAILEVDDTYMKPFPTDSIHGLNRSASSSSSSDSAAESVELSINEPMDYVVTPGTTPASVDSVLQSSDNHVDDNVDDTLLAPVLTHSASAMQIDIIAETSNIIPVLTVTPETLTVDDIWTLVDLFYLPFEHGRQAVKMLTDFHWLKTNVPVAQCHSVAAGGAETNWTERARLFVDRVRSVVAIIDRVLSIPNKALLFELFPYLWDIKGALLLVITFVQWLGGNRIYGECSTNGEREPWLFRGGLLGEFQRMLPFESCADLLFYTCPDVPQSVMYTVRQYMPLDKEAVYRVCLQTCNDGLDAVNSFSKHPNLMGDKLVGAFLCYCPEMCFVIEDGTHIVGYVLVASDARSFYQKLESDWIPLMLEKYRLPDNVVAPLSFCEEMIGRFHSYKNFVPDSLLERHPSCIRVDMLHENRMHDSSALIRALASAVAALKVVGSCGIHANVNVGSEYVAETYRRFGFFEIPYADSPEDLVRMGRLI